jgi:hypothetical protein
LIVLTALPGSRLSRPQLSLKVRFVANFKKTAGARKHGCALCGKKDVNLQAFDK